jgi:hypothetical protein
MGNIGGRTLTQRRRVSRGLIGILAFVAICATACGSASGGDPLPGGAEHADSPTGHGEAEQRFAAPAASVEFDPDAFAEIKPGGPRDVDLRRFRQLIDRDRIVPVYDPLIVSAEEADFTPDELVMGVALNGESRAYGVGMMRSREIANDELGGVPLLVTW